MRILIGAAALTAAQCFLPLPARAEAEDVTLRARSGSLAVSGTLLGYDGASYRVASRFGLLTVEADSVDCSGPGCPELTSLTSELRLAVDPWLVDLLLLPRIRSYAEAEGLDLSNIEVDGRLELARAGRTELRLWLRPPGTDPAALLAAGDIDVLLAAAPATAGTASGRLVARMPFRLLSGAEAPAGRLGLQDLAAMRGAAADWAALGAPSQPVVWHGLRGAPSLAAAAERAFGPGQAERRDSPDPAGLGLGLGQDPWGLALLPQGMVAAAASAAHAKGLALVERRLADACGFELDLSDLAIASGDDPLALPIYWREAGARLPAPARRLAHHLTTAPGTAQGAAPGLDLPPRPLAEMGQRLLNAGLDPNPHLAPEARRAALAALAGAARLPHTFRPLVPGSGDMARLDPGAEAAFEDLVQRLATGLGAGQEVLLVGFGPAGAKPAAVERASLSAAETLRARLAAELDGGAAAVRLGVLGLGAALPLACATSPDATRANDRVEVWLRPLQD